MNNLQIGDKALVTCDNWFYAPDGNMYRAAHGTVNAVLTAEDTLGVRPNGKSTNWYLELGNMTIAGCQIHYVVKTERYVCDKVRTHHVHDGRYVESTRPCEIYDADRECE